MKKMMNFALMAVLTVGLSLAVTSCKDDNNDSDNGSGNGEPTAEELAVEHAETFWSVAANLVSPFDVTTEYENKTFEPTIGSPLDGNTTIRVVNCGSMASAASRFTSITGVEIDENTTTSTYQDDAVGTLVYTKTNDATSLATIDVSIKQIPHLQKIIFKTSEQMGANGKFSGTAYYSFGDVIALDNEDGLQEYWVCVRPALGPAGKEDTHWVTLSQLPDKNVWTYEGKKKPITFRLPQQLGTDEIQMQNLAELLYAVCNPEQWWKNLQDNKGVDLFGDLYHERAQYFNQYFWQTVQKFWSDKSAGQSISEKLFGYDFDEMKKIINDQNALHLLRKGFSWYTTSSNSPTLYEYTYSNGTGKKSNMHSYKSKSVSKNVMTGDGIKLDCVADYTQNHWICPAFFGDEQPRFIFRFATGKELFGADPGVFQSMRGGKRNIKDVYVLNEMLEIPTQSELKVFTEADVPNSTKAPTVGQIIGFDGNIYDTKDDASLEGGGSAAVIVYLGGNKRVETGKSWNGLAISTGATIVTAKWNSDGYADACPNLPQYNNINDAKLAYNGIQVSNILANDCKTNGHKHPVVDALIVNRKVNSQDGSISSWFVPSLGQWYLVLQSLGGTWEGNTISINAQKLDELGLKRLFTEQGIWTTSSADENNAYLLPFNTNAPDVIRSTPRSEQKSTTHPTIGFIAFRYGNGGTQEP